MTSFWRSLRNVFGFYSFTREESADFNPGILSAFNRLASEFERLQPPQNPVPPAVPPSPLQLAFAAVHPQTADLIATIRAHPSACTRSDLYTIEASIIQICEADYIPLAYPSIRERYRGIAGSEVYKAYIEGQRPDPKQSPADSETLRQDALHLISEMRRLAIALPRREQIRSWLLVDLLLLHSIIASVLIVVLFTWDWNHFPFAWIVALWSLIGGVISVIRRMQGLPDEELNLAQWGRLPILVSPITSICFGLVLFYLFSGRILAGQIFPNMDKIYAYNLSPAPPTITVKEIPISSKTPREETRKHSGISTRNKTNSQRNPLADPKDPGPTNAMSNQVACTLSVTRENAPPPGAPSGFVASNTDTPNDIPTSCADKTQMVSAHATSTIKPVHANRSEDGFDLFHWMLVISFPEFAKLVVWAFIAGFAENFVPDTLDSLVKRKKS